MAWNLRFPTSVGFMMKTWKMMQIRMTLSNFAGRSYICSIKIDICFCGLYRGSILIICINYVYDVRWIRRVRGLHVFGDFNVVVEMVMTRIWKSRPGDSSNLSRVASTHWKLDRCNLDPMLRRPLDLVVMRSWCFVFGFKMTWSASWTVDVVYVGDDLLSFFSICDALVGRADFHPPRIPQHCCK